MLVPYPWAQIALLAFVTDADQPGIKCNGADLGRERLCLYRSTTHSSPQVCRRVLSSAEGEQEPRRTHDEAKVNVEEAPLRREHEVVIVAVPHAQDVSHYAVPRAALHKRVQHLRAQPEGPCGQSRAAQQANSAHPLPHGRAEPCHPWGSMEAQW